MIRVSPLDKAIQNMENRALISLLILSHIEATQLSHMVPGFLYRPKDRDGKRIIEIELQQLHSIVNEPQGQGFSQRVMKSQTACSISKTVVVLPTITVMQFDFEPFSDGMPPEKIVKVSLRKNKSDKKRNENESHHSERESGMGVSGMRKRDKWFCDLPSCA